MSSMILRICCPRMDNLERYPKCHDDRDSEQTKKSLQQPWQEFAHFKQGQHLIRQRLRILCVLHLGRDSL